MKILFDHQIFSWQKYGGISRYFFELSNNLKRNFNGNEISIVSPIYVNDYLINIDSDVNVIGCHAPHIPRTGRIFLTFNWLFSFFVNYKKKPDIIHETYYSKYSIASNNSKIIITVFDMIHELYADKFPRRDATTKNKRIAVERADHIICISENTRQDLIRLFKVNPSKVSVVYLGFSLSQQKFERNYLTKKPYLLYVGLRSGYKNFEAFLQAYATSDVLNKQYDLIAFGGGAFTLKENFEIKRLGLNLNQVRQISGNDNLLSAIYKNATLFVYPSLYEGFGIPPLEAMSFDCPVVCSNTSSMPEVVGDAAYLFNPQSYADIQEALELVIDNVDLQNDLRRKGKLRVQAFSWQKCAEETLQIYKKVLQ